MSENTINAALRRLGYSSEEMTGHGFRSMAATGLHEMGWKSDPIERQLEHAETNKVREAYTHAAQYLEERTRMMQAWADCAQWREGCSDPSQGGMLKRQLRC
ncbi:tyrosine-type recombinase/integrase [Rhodanobacter ginsengisoli]|uniref:Tyrosine-type recombinase/integrase n=1 Tax=Rhodanobacter ginsengisoli TaxID=418646 RepID=A0ABW0QLS6_9GAMM